MLALARYNILKRDFPPTPKLLTLGIIDEDDFFDEIIDIMDDDEEENEEDDELFT